MCEWKSIQGYEGLYLINELGQIKCLQKRGSNGGIRKEKIIKQRIHNGYWYVNLSKNTVCKTFQVHRLIANSFIPNPENKPFINHINGIKNDNRVENLEWCTPYENVVHAFKTGLSKGSSHVPDDVVLEIIDKFFNQKKTLSQLSREYNIKPHTVYYYTIGVNRKNILEQFKNQNAA